MQRIGTIGVLMIFGALPILAQTQASRAVKVVYPVRTGESKSLIELAKEMKPGTLHKQGAGDREIPNRFSNVTKPDESGATFSIDAAWQRAAGQRAAAAPTLVIEGLSSDDNSALLGFRVAPSDVNGDVGPNHIVEMVNLLYRVWNKSGTPLIPPISTDALWSGFGGNCEFNNDGDPIVFYDEINDRWILSQFVFSVSQCIACSKTGDPTGEYWLYEYSTPGNDYPKMSNMPGAYYGTIRNFSATFKMDAHAWNGAKIRVGDPTAEMIVQTMTGVTGIDGVQPVDLDGPPPASSPGIFVGHDDTNDRLYMYEMTPNFTAGTATLTGPTFISVPAYSSSFPLGIQQLGTTQRLDILSPFVRFVSHLRDFGTHQSLIVNHVVDINDFADHAGERWYELRKSGTGPWTLHQSGSYAPDAHHRWMGNAAIDKNGAIGLAYTTSSSTLNPSIRYTGREAADPLGVMTLAEGVIAAGTGSQTGTGRWGDYSRITVDPADGETFWYFGGYVQQTGSFEWNTKIGSFKVASTPTPPTITSTPNTSATVGVAYSYDANNTVEATGSAPITFSLLTGPTGFSVTSAGVVSWTPTSGQVGPHTVQIQATNAFGSDTQTYTVTVSAAPPYAARINCGGTVNFTDGSGNVFVADKAFVAGSFGHDGLGSTGSTTSAISNTTDDALYQTFRRVNGTSNFSYKFDVPSAGNYNVTLYFTEPQKTASGQRLFDVTIEGVIRLDNYDIFAASGGQFFAKTETFTINVVDGQLNVVFTGVVSGAIVSAIAVVGSTPTPDISVAPTSLSFGNVNTGSSSDLTVAVSNVGSANLDVTALSTTNSTFTVVSPTTPFTITPSGTPVNVTVRFSPTAAGLQSGNLQITSNDPDENPLNVALTGTGVTPPPSEPDIRVTPTSLAYGQVIVGQTSDKTVTIFNDGTVILNVTGLATTNAAYSVVSPTTPFTVAANGGSQIVTVRFAPTAVGTATGNLNITSDDPDEGLVTVSLTGEGITVVPYAARINCGGTVNFTDGSGNVFVADKAFVAGSFGHDGLGSTGSTTSAISNTTDDALYQTFRRVNGTSNFSYKFDVPSAGNYVVTLFFTEPQKTASGQRLFDVTIEGVIRLDNYDIFAASGGQFFAKTETFTINVVDGQLNVVFTGVTSGALVSAIAVVSSSAPQVAKHLRSEQIAGSLPDGFQLYQNHPNPFIGQTSIRYAVANGARVVLKIYSLLGEEVATLVEQNQQAGVFSVVWDGKDRHGRRVAPGVYIGRLESGGMVDMRKMILLQ
ncbi:MAG: malectin domain-containing carbohydrate-binding protein [candidate division KSB1 bacterium]|nr:malectin domain-containing carbohydrate-binding protein [candidate division KSB1 bacterium]MDZ7367443.1 malectin domain-containing carbohydrate-binding protein [candidate division KSB1 bacterium]MDZ7405452.1 malectin domain-containing carbohydrate-binding protein [candidate division KSB1 bacterium]